MEKFIIDGGYICDLEFMKPIPYTHPSFMEVYDWANNQPPSRIVGDLRWERTCVLARMMNNLHPGYTHSVRDGLIAVFDQRQYDYFQGTFIVQPWLRFLIMSDYHVTEMTVEQFLQRFLAPTNLLLASMCHEILPTSLQASLEDQYPFVRKAGVEKKCVH